MHLVEDIFNETAARCTCRLLKGLKIFTNLGQRFSCDLRSPAITWDILEFCSPKALWQMNAVLTKLGNFWTWDSDRYCQCLLHVTVSDFIVRDLSEHGKIRWKFTAFVSVSDSQMEKHIGNHMNHNEAIS